MFIPILIPMHHPNFDALHFSNVEEPQFYQTLEEPSIPKQTYVFWRQVPLNLSC